MSPETEITLKEYIDLRFAESHTAILSLKTLIEARMNSMDRALELQATEYKSRLEDLNHAHVLAEKDRSRYMLSDRFETFKEQTIKDTSIIKEYIAGEKAKQTTLNVVISVVISLCVGIIIKFVR